MLIFPTDFPLRKSFKELLKPIHLIGRRKYLDQISDSFQNCNKPIVLYSFGGVDKTTVALEYCNLLLQKNPDSYIRWFASDTSQNFEIQYKRLAKLLDIEINEDDFEFTIERTNMKLKKFQKDILFVLDNVEKFDYVQKYFKFAPNNIKILITSRDQLSDLNSVSIFIEPFSLDEARCYVSKNLKIPIDEDQSSKIIELVKTKNKDILPIKLEKIVSYINCYYLNNIEKSLSNIVNANYLDNQVEFTLFLQLKLDEDGSLETLHYCSFLNPDFVSIELISRILDDKIDVNQVVDKLNSLSLLTVVEKDDKLGIKMHRLIQEEIKDYIENNKSDQLIKNDNFKLYQKLLLFFDDQFKSVDQDPKSWDDNKESYIHVLSLMTESSKYSPNKKLVLELIKKLWIYEFYNNFNYKILLNRGIELYEMQKSFFGKSDHADIGLAYEKLKNFRKSLEFKLSCFEMQQRIFGVNVDHPDKARSLNAIGYAHEKLKNYNESLEYKLNSLKMQKRIFGNKDHADVARSLNAIGVCYEKLKNYEKSLEFKLNSYNMRIRLFGDEQNLDIARSLNSIGVGYERLNEYEKSLQFFFKCFEMQKKLFANVENPHLAESLSSIAYVYGKQKKFHKSLEFYLKAYEQQKCAFGDVDRADIARSLSNLGVAYEFLNDFHKSLEYYLKSFEMRKRLFSRPYHPDIVDSLSSIEAIYDKLNDHEKSLEFKLKLLEAQKRILNKVDHHEIASSLNNIGVTYFKLNKFETSLEYKIKAYEMRKRLLNGNDHNDLARLLSNIGMGYDILGKYEKSLEYYFKSFEMQKRLLGNVYHLDIVKSLFNIGFAYKKLKKYENSLWYHLEALEMRKKLLGDVDHLDSVQSLNSIGFAYFKLDYYEKATENLLKAYCMIKRISSDGENLAKARILNNLAMVNLKNLCIFSFFKYKFKSVKFFKRLKSK